MSSTTTIHAHIAYELIDDTIPGVVAIEFLSQEIAGPHRACELLEELDSLPMNSRQGFGRHDLTCLGVCSSIL